jgi:hypothetical protein
VFSQGLLFKAFKIEGRSKAKTLAPATEISDPQIQKLSVGVKGIGAENTMTE